MNPADDATRDENLSLVAAAAEKLHAPPAAASASNPDDLIGPEVRIPLSGITQIENPRSHYDKAELESLAASIEKHGLLQAVIVREAGPEAFELIAGTRRFRAYQLLATRNPADPRWRTIRASVQAHSGARLKVVQAIENIRRAELSVLELAAAVDDLKTSGLDEAGIAAELGYSKRHVERLLAIQSSPGWLRRLGQEVQVTEPVLDKDGQKVTDDEGRPTFQKRNLPGFGFEDLHALVGFHAKLDAWDRKQQDQNTGHRPKAESETLRQAQRAAANSISGAKLKEALRTRLALITGVGPNPRDSSANGAPAGSKPVTLTPKKLVVDFSSLNGPLSPDDLARIKPDLTEALQRLGFSTIKLG